MKSPKEILLEQAAEAGPSLDKIRGQIVRDLAEPERRRSILGGFFADAWSELFWQSRNTWGALAAVWALLLIIGGSQETSLPLGGRSAKQPLPAKAAWERHHDALRAELGIPLERETQKPKTRKPAVIHQSRFPNHFEHV